MTGSKGGEKMGDTNSTTTFRADISQLRKEMQAAGRAVRLANSEFKAATAGLDDWSSSADGLSAKITQLNTKLEAQKTQARLAKEEWEKITKEYGENSAEADRAKIKLNNYEAEVANTEKELKQYQQDLKDIENGTKGVTDATQEASDGFTVMKGVIADLAASAIKAGINGLKKLAGAAKEAYEEFDEGQDNVIKATGATGEAAKELTKSYKNVAHNVIGDFSDIGSTLGEVNTRFGYTGEQLESTTEQFLKFAEITGTDATSAVQLVSRAMGDAGIDAEDYGEVLDALAVAAQASGISVDKLTENLTKYGAPMRALGFDTKESIALFSQWEKAGVNTEIAFSGMKKAIGNWGKEGKDARKEFKKTLKEIEEAPDIADATAKAIEVFGTKAGPDLADAIQNGRFAYEDFLELIEGSAGAVENTYEETQDGYDKIKLAIQGVRADMGDFVGELLSEHEPEITEFIGTVTEKAKEFVKWVIDNGDTVKRVLTGIAGTLSTIFVVNKVSGFIKSLGTLGGAFVSMGTKMGILKAATDAQATSTLALNTAWLASPITWLIAGTAALAVGLTALNKKYQESIQAEYGLSDAQQKTIEKASDLASDYSNMASARSESFASIDSEYDYLENLKEEYNSLLTSNGNVKKGYEERAELIKTTLANALGIERNEIDENIRMNGRLGDSIDELIKKKQAEAMLLAAEGAYDEAKGKWQEAMLTYTDALKTAEEKQQAYTEKQAEAEAAWKEFSENAQLYGAQAASGYLDKYNELQHEADVAKEAAETAEAGARDAETAYLGYISTIQNYEGLTSAIISGDADAISDALLNMQYDFVTSENGTRTLLENQVKNLQDSYARMKDAVEQGMPGVSEKNVNEIAQMVEKAEAELAKFDADEAMKQNAEAIERSASSQLDSALVGVGSKTVEVLTNELEDGNTKIEEALANLGVHLDFSDFVANAEGYGTDFTKQLASAITTGESIPNDAVSNLASQINQTLSDNGSSFQIGSDFTLGYSDGILSLVDDATGMAVVLAKDTAGALKSELDEHSPSKVTYEVGENFTEGFAKGIESNENDAISAVKALANKVILQLAASAQKTENAGMSAGTQYALGMKSQSASAYASGKTIAASARSGAQSVDATQSGQYFGQGFVNGINSYIQAAINKATELARAALNAVKEAQKEGSPSKLTYQSGVYFTQGYINGIASQQKTLVHTVQGLVATVIKELSNASGYNFDVAGENASSAFSDAINKKVNYTISKMQYQNEAMLSDFDNTITNITKEKEKAASNLQKESNKKVNALQKKYDASSDKNEKAKLKKQINAEKARVKKLIAASDKQYEKQIKTQQKYKEAYQTASSEMISEFSTALNEYQNKAQALIDDTISGITEKYDQRYEELINKQDNLIDKLKNASDLFEISSAGIMTVNDIQEQTKQIREYAEKLKDIKARVSAELFDQIASYDMKEGSAFMDRLLAMSAADLDAYNKAYTEKMEAAQEAGESIYKSDFEQVSRDYQKEIDQAFRDLPQQLENLGIQAMKGFVDGLTTNTDYMSKNIKTFISGMVDSFKEILQIHSPSRVMFDIGEYTGEGFNDGLVSMLSYVKKTAKQLSDLVSEPLDNVKGNIGDIRAKVRTADGGINGTTDNSQVVNNYNLVQNNTSPKSLSALETYQARRRQIAMVKAVM